MLKCTITETIYHTTVNSHCDLHFLYWVLLKAGPRSAATAHSPLHCLRPAAQSRFSTDFLFDY